MDKLSVWVAPFLLLTSLVFSSCSTANVNPSLPRANTGYVDFYAESDLDLSWQVKRLDPQTGEMRSVFSELQPLAGNVLRLAQPLGVHQYEVWFLNQLTEGPKTVQVAVEPAKVTPIRITLTAIGSAAVKQQTYGYNPSARGYNRGTKTTLGVNEVFRIEASPQTPLEYQPKERMNYYSTGAK